jgi:hypothetical protein
MGLLLLLGIAAVFAWRFPMYREEGTSAPKFCPNCGLKVSGGFCPNCGKEVGSSTGRPLRRIITRFLRIVLAFSLFFQISSAYACLVWSAPLLKESDDWSQVPWVGPVLMVYLLSCGCLICTGVFAEIMNLGRTERLRRIGIRFAVASLVIFLLLVFLPMQVLYETSRYTLHGNGSNELQPLFVSLLFNLVLLHIILKIAPSRSVGPEPPAAAEDEPAVAQQGAPAAPTSRGTGQQPAGTCRCTKCKALVLVEPDTEKCPCCGEALRTGLARRAEGLIKKCPDCAEDVRPDARKCRFCGFAFPSEPTE